MNEEAMSAIIAWLLNPSMEHGLGATVLGKLIDRIHKSNPLKDYDNVKDALRPRLRTGDETIGSIDCHLEYLVQHNSDNSYIDVVFIIGKLVLCIENKINAGSTSLEQFKNEYLGMINTAFSYSKSNYK